MIFTNEDLEQIPFTSKKYANQKSMYIHKAAVDKDHIYSLISQEAHMKALNDFGWSAAYNLWVYLCCNQDGYIENFSPTHIGQLAHKDRRTIQRAVKELEDKGYLFQVAENDYIFFENPNDNGCDIDATSLGCSTSVTSLNINKEENLDKKRCDIDATGGATSVSQGATLVLQECDTGVYSNIINNIDNINNNIELSSQDKSAKATHLFKESHVITKCDKGVITKCNNGENDNMDKVVHMDKVVQVSKNNEIKNQHGQSCPHDMDNLVHPTWTKLSTNMDKVVHSNITYNTYNNTIDNTKLSSHNSSTEVENCFKESHVITKCNNETCDTGATGFVYNSRIDGEKDIDKVVHVLDKDELRPIHTSDGAVVELPIRNILDGLKDALTNKKNESTIKEIREKCDLTEKQKKDIDDTLDFWELDW